MYTFVDFGKDDGIHLLVAEASLQLYNLRTFRAWYCEEVTRSLANVEGVLTFQLHLNSVVYSVELLLLKSLSLHRFFHSNELFIGSKC